MASGTRFLFNFHRCRGPITLEEGFNLGQLVLLVQKRGMKVLNASLVPYPDGTVNFHLDLGESHISGGIYLDSRHVAGEVHVCNESSDNRAKGEGTVQDFVQYFDAEGNDVHAIPWESR